MAIYYWRCGHDLSWQCTCLPVPETYVAFGYACNESCWIIPGTVED